MIFSLHKCHFVQLHEFDSPILNFLTKQHKITQTSIILGNYSII